VVRRHLRRGVNFISFFNFNFLFSHLLLNVMLTTRAAGPFLLLLPLFPLTHLYPFHCARSALGKMAADQCYCGGISSSSRGRAGTARSCCKVQQSWLACLPDSSSSGGRGDTS
jgi:hypothetical protein